MDSQNWPRISYRTKYIYMQCIYVCVCVCVCVYVYTSNYQQPFILHCYQKIYFKQMLFFWTLY